MKSFKVVSYKSVPRRYEDDVKKYKREAFEEVFGTLSKKEIENRKEKFFSQNDIFKFLLAIEKREVIGGLSLLKREINYSDKQFVLGGIGGVWTRIDKRKMGVASELLVEGMKILNKSNCKIALLRTDVKKLGELYSKVGFTPLSKKYSFSGKSGKKYYDSEGMLANLSDRKLFNQIINSRELLNIGNGNW